MFLAMSYAEMMAKFTEALTIQTINNSLLLSFITQASLTNSAPEEIERPFFEKEPPTSGDASKIAPLPTYDNNFCFRMLFLYIFDRVSSQTVSAKVGSKKKSKNADNVSNTSVGPENEAPSAIVAPSQEENLTPPSNNAQLSIHGTGTPIIMNVG